MAIHCVSLLNNCSSGSDLYRCIFLNTRIRFAFVTSFKWYGNGCADIGSKRTTHRMNKKYILWKWCSVRVKNLKFCKNKTRGFMFKRWFCDQFSLAMVTKNIKTIFWFAPSIQIYWIHLWRLNYHLSRRLIFLWRNNVYITSAKQ